MPTYPIHPVADALPLMTEEEFATLRASMERRGWVKDEPAILYKGQVLDGRNRLRAAEELELEPHYEDRTNRVDDPVEWVARRNLARRSVSPSQRAAVAVAFMPALQEQARKRKGKGYEPEDGEPSGRARIYAAELTGVSPRLIQYAMKLDAGRLQRVRDGELTVQTALRELDLPTGQPPTQPDKPVEQAANDPPAISVEDIMAAAEQLGDYDLGLVATKLRQRVRANKEPGADPDSWCTPPEVMDPVRDFLGGIGLDPFSNAHSIVGAEVSWTVADDAFAQDWINLDLAVPTMFMNPFYSGGGEPFDRFVVTAHETERESCIFAKGDWSTDWWNEYIRKRAAAVCYWANRVKFLLGGGKFATAMFPNALCYYGSDPARFKQAFKRHGHVEVLRRKSL